ncbi:MAG: hypothetical protein ABH824_05230 [Nanoarchaeota archaeon]|nr:hypothetical protein [Nanoarchaeota archaeon]MBU1632813.1 hypothetical protein [Nanoarchaeota archaeon]MBU1876494.1 hypothetical protein [Nanoarchaeota archaeon]
MKEYKFFFDGYFSRAYAFDEQTEKYLREKDLKKVTLVELTESELEILMREKRKDELENT